MEMANLLTSDVDSHMIKAIQN